MLVSRNGESVTVQAFFLRKPRENLSVLPDVKVSKLQGICYVLWMAGIPQQWDVKAVGSERLASLLDASLLAQSTEPLSPPHLGILIPVHTEADRLEKVLLT